jgi:ABC-2 type transport system permease protein
MRPVWLIALNDLRVYFSQRGNWIIITVLPVLFTVVLGLAFGGGGDEEPSALRVDVLDEDGTPRSLQLVANLRALNESWLFCPDGNDTGDTGEDRCGLAGEPLTLARGQERVTAGDSAALIVIPAGYADAVATRAEFAIDYYTNASPGAPDPVFETLSAAVERANRAAFNAGVADALLDRIAARAGLAETIRPRQETIVRDVSTRTEMLLAQRPPLVRFVPTGGQEDGPEAGIGGFGQSVPGIGSSYVMLTVLGGMVILLRERQRWTLQRVAALPITRGQVLGGKILTYFTLGMIQYLIVFSVGLVVGLDFGPNPLLLLPVMCAFVLCCTALTFAIAPMLRSEGQANNVASLLGLTLAPLGGGWWPLEIVSETMQRVGHLSPVAWAMDAFRDLIYYGGGLADILPEVAVLLAAAVVLFGIGVWRFRIL